MSSVFVSNVLTRALPTFAVLAILGLARKYLKTPPQDVEEAEHADVRLPSVLLVNFATIAVGSALVVATHWALVVANRYMATRDIDAQIVLYPSSAIWWFLPGFAGLTFAWEITLQLWKRFNPRQASAYRAYSNLKSGFDSTKMLRMLAYGVALPIGIASILALPIHTSLTESAILDGRFAKLHEDSFPYSDATELIEFDGDRNRDGSFSPRAGILVRFKDGRSWNSAGTHDPVRVEDPKLIAFLLRKTGIPAHHLEILPN